MSDIKFTPAFPLILSVSSFVPTCFHLNCQLLRGDQISHFKPFHDSVHLPGFSPSQINKLIFCRLEDYIRKKTFAKLQTVCNPYSNKLFRPMTYSPASLQVWGCISVNAENICFHPAKCKRRLFQRKLGCCIVGKRGSGLFYFYLIFLWGIIFQASIVLQKSLSCIFHRVNKTNTLTRVYKQFRIQLTKCANAKPGHKNKIGPRKRTEFI